MIIHISSELVEKINKAIDKEKKLFNEFIEKLLITSIKEGKHIISISKRDLSILKKYEFIDEKNKQYLKILDTIRSKVFQNLENLINKIGPSDVIKITYNKFDNVKNEKNNINFRYIPFLEFIDSETLSRTTIVSEHIKNDGTIYEKFFPEVYKEYKKLPFNFYLQKEMGGGSTIYSVLKEKCNENIIGFYIFISDSDKNNRNSEYGKTASDMLEEYEKCKKNDKSNYLKFKIYILNVRELENLIPLFFFKEYKASFYNILFYNMYLDDCKYVDIKKELNEKKLLKKFNQKYNSNLDSFIDLLFNNCENLIVKNNWIEIGRIIYSWGVGFGKQHIL